MNGGGGQKGKCEIEQMGQMLLLVLLPGIGGSGEGRHE